MKERRKRIHWKSWMGAAIMVGLIQYDLVHKYIDSTWGIVSFVLVLILVYAKDFANNGQEVTISAGPAGVSITEKKDESTTEFYSKLPPAPAAAPPAQRGN